MLLEQNDKYTIYGKTGESSKNKLGWFVGFINIDKRDYIFVTMLNSELASGGYVKEITFKVLNQLILNKKP